MPVEKLIPHLSQLMAIERMKEEPTHAALLASDTGTGKTLVAMQFVVEMGFTRCLIIGIRDTAAQFADRIEAQSDGRLHLRRIDTTKAGRTNHAAMLAGEDGVFFSGSQFLTAQDWATEGQGDNRQRVHLKTYAKMKPLDALIYDELHVVANRKAVGRRTLLSLKTDWKIGASATPYGNSFAGSWSICRWLWPDHIDTAFSRWSAEWCATKTQYVTGRREITLITGEKIPGEFVKTLPCYIRTEAEEVPSPSVFHVDLTPQQRADYESTEEDGVAWLASHPDLRPMVTSLPITKQIRLRQMTLGVMSMTDEDDVYFHLETESTKLAALRQIVDGWEPQPILIYVDSKRFAKVTVARMQRAGYAAVEWSGDVSSKDRDRIKADFIHGRVRFIVAVTSSFSTGLDGFQTVCNKIIWLSQSQDNRHNLQAVARIFRQGMTQAHGGFSHVAIVARDTIDEGTFSRKAAETIALRSTLKAA